jgi:hypothetical protein
MTVLILSETGCRSFSTTTLTWELSFSLVGADRSDMQKPHSGGIQGTLA